MRASVALSSELKSGLLVTESETQLAQVVKKGIDSCCWEQGWVQAWLPREADHVKRAQCVSVSVFCFLLCGTQSPTTLYSTWQQDGSRSSSPFIPGGFQSNGKEQIHFPNCLIQSPRNEHPGFDLGHVPDTVARNTLTGSSLVTCWFLRREIIRTHELGMGEKVVSQIEMRTWHQRRVEGSNNRSTTIQ